MTAPLARAGAAALLLVASATRAEPGEALAVHAEPATLLLRHDARATVFVDSGTSSPPTLSASVGRIEDVLPLGDGRYAASYVPPSEAYPQVALVIAMTGERFGHVAIPLVGRGLAVARASPGASIQVTIGEASFGPVRADRRGEARVPVVVPPGVRFAYHRGEPLDLKVPPTLHVHLAAARAEVPADAAADVPLALVALAPDGSPRAGAPLEVSATQGAIELVEVSPGAFAGRWRLPAGAAGVASATARLRDEPGPSITAAVSRPAGAPARFEIAGAPARVSVEDDGPLRLGVSVTDAAGNPVSTALRVETTFGTASEPVAVGPGAWEVSLAFPRTLGTARCAALTFRAAELEERVELALVPGAPVRLAIAQDVPALVADGRAASRIRVSALDRFGNVAPVPPPVVEVTRPALVSADADDATWIVGYRPHRARQDAAEVVSIRSGALESSARITLVAPERRVSVAPRLGLGLTTGGVATPYAGAEASYSPQALAGRVAFSVELGWVGHERTDSATVGGVELDVRGRARYAPLLASAWWREPLGGRFLGWAGVGGGVAPVSSEVSAGTQDALVGSGLATAAHVSLAIARRVGHGAPFLELRALRLGPPGLDAFDGALTVLSFSAGYRYDAY